jgi:ABC-type sugar transport system substrate-binding protein
MPTTESKSRCVAASEKQFANIQDGVKSVAQDNYIQTAWAVKSRSFENVWMVAAKIYGPGMESGTGPGVWAMGGEPDSPNMILAVDGFAKEFSPYPDAAKTKAAITTADDGVSEALACAENN